MIISLRNKWTEKKLVKKTPTGRRQKQTENWRFNYWKKIVVFIRWIWPKIDLKFSVDLWFAIFFQRRTLETLKTLRQINFSGLLILDSPQQARSFDDFRKFKWLSASQISVNNVQAQKKTAPAFPSWSQNWTQLVLSKSTSMRSVAFLVW